MNKKVEAYARGQMKPVLQAPGGGDGTAPGDKARLAGLRALANHSPFGLAAPSSERSSRTDGGV
jgi:hypothetical protein